MNLNKTEDELHYHVILVENTVIRGKEDALLQRHT
jgi:hypothetical protein